MDIEKFILLTGLAILTKMSSSIDDIAWLLPYVRSESAALNAAVYVLLMQAVVWTSVLGSILGREAIGALVSDSSYWTAERVLGLASGCLLACFTAYLFHDWWTGSDSDEDDEALLTMNHFREIIVHLAAAMLSGSARDTTGPRKAVRLADSRDR